MPSHIPHEIATGAQSLLGQINGGVAAVLFGSRAREDWCEQSDWDIAFITSKTGKYTTALGDESPLSEARKLGHEVNCLLLPTEVLEERCQYLGAVQRAIVRDGVPIVGDWQVDSLKRVRLKMDKEMYHRHVIMARKSILAASQSYQDIASGTLDISHIQAEGAEFVAHSADAAERLGKATLIALGIDPVATHDMHALANQADEAGHGEDARMLHSLNGNTRHDHVAHYEFQRNPVESAHDAAQRFIGVVSLYVRTVQSLSRSLPWNRKTETEDKALEGLKQVAKAFQSSPNEKPKARAPDTDALLSYHDQLKAAAADAFESLTRFIEARDWPSG